MNETRQGRGNNSILQQTCHVPYITFLWSWEPMIQTSISSITQHVLERPTTVVVYLGQSLFDVGEKQLRMAKLWWVSEAIHRNQRWLRERGVLSCLSYSFPSLRSPPAQKLIRTSSPLLRAIPLRSTSSGSHRDTSKICERGLKSVADQKHLLLFQSYLFLSYLCFMLYLILSIEGS